MATEDEDDSGESITFRQVGSFPISAEEIQRSALFRDLRHHNFPPELAMVHGLHDMQIAMTLEHLQRSFAWMLDNQGARILLELWKLELRLRRRENNLAVDAAATGAVLGANAPYAPFASFPGFQVLPGIGPLAPLPPLPPPTPPNTGIPMPFTLPIKAGVTLTVNQAIGTETNATGDQVAVAGTPDNFIGIATSVSSNVVTIALPGDRFFGFSNLVPGAYYLIYGTSGTITTAATALGSTTDSTIEVKTVLKAISKTMAIVIDWPAAAISQPSF